MIFILLLFIAVMEDLLYFQYKVCKTMLLGCEKFPYVDKNITEEGTKNLKVFKLNSGKLSHVVVLAVEKVLDRHKNNRDISSRLRSVLTGLRVVMAKQVYTAQVYTCLSVFLPARQNIC